MPRKPIDFFGEDSPLFAKPPSKKKVAKKKIAIKKRKRKKIDLVDSPLFVKKEEPKKRGPKSHAELAEEEVIKENKRVAAKRKRAAHSKKTKKPNKVYPDVETPEECKNILPAFKKFLTAKWKLLTGTDAEAATVSGYISGAMTVCSNNEKRQKEYDELYVLRAIAKRIYSERS